MDPIQDALQALRTALGTGPIADRLVPIQPTPEALRAEISTGPQSARLLPLWNTVFEAPDDDPPEPDTDDPFVKGRWRSTCQSNDVKRQRAGRIHPDSAYDIVQVLLTTGRMRELGWHVDPQLVTAAHNEGLG
jgi:hypothetical protein